MNKSLLHAIFGFNALCIISTFWLSTFISELFLGQNAIAIVKHLIANYGLIVLVIVMAGLGISGNLLGKKRKGKLIDAKKKRMPIIAFNGIFIMVPSALYLNYKASHGEFDSLFYAVQIVELLVGLIQISLLGLSFRDGLKLSGRLR